MMLRAAAVALGLLGDAGRGAIPIDRTAVVFLSPDTGGPDHPRAITERELAFEARLEALAVGEAPDDERGLPKPRFLRAAIDRHVATELLASTPLERRDWVMTDPCTRARRVIEDERKDLEARITLSRAMLVARVRGESKLTAAAEREGMSEGDVLRFLRREALAARYVDLVIAPMVVPSATEIRDAHRAIPGLRDRPLAEVSCDVARLLFAERLGRSLAQYRESSRSRVELAFPDR